MRVVRGTVCLEVGGGERGRGKGEGNILCVCVGVGVLGPRHVRIISLLFQRKVRKIFLLKIVCAVREALNSPPAS